MNKVWVLTIEHNDYDQYGAYFVAWFPKKPTSEKLLEYGCDRIGRSSKWEDQWFLLEEVDAG